MYFMRSISHICIFGNVQTMLIDLRGSKNSLMINNSMTWNVFNVSKILCWVETVMLDFKK
jgi:hypothetical protein